MSGTSIETINAIGITLGTFFITGGLIYSYYKGPRTFVTFSSLLVIIYAIINFIVCIKNKDKLGSYDIGLLLGTSLFMMLLYLLIMLIFLFR